MNSNFYQNINISQLKKMTYSVNESMTPFHEHYPLEIIYCTNGAAAIEYYDKNNKLVTVVVEHNTVCMIKPLVRHRQYSLIDNTSILLIEFCNKINYESNVLNLFSSNLCPFDENTVSIINSIPVISFFKDDTLQLYNNMNNLFDIMQAQEKDGLFYLKYYVQVVDLFCNLALKQKNSKNFPPSNKYVKVATIYIAEHYFDTELSIDDISSAAQVSNVYLQKLFKEYFGKTVKQYVTEKRIREAKKLLKTKLPLYQIAKNVGYKNYVTFYKEFMKHEKKSFSEYRESIMAENVIIRNI